MKRGMTLIELIVAITLFVTVVTLALGSFVSISRTKLLVSSMKESQNKIRLISEMVTRFGKEADSVMISEGGKNIDFKYYKRDQNDLILSTSLKRFELSLNGESFKYVSCPDATDLTKCSSEELLNVTDLGYKYQVTDREAGQESYKIFTKKNTIPPTLELNIRLKNITTSNNHFNDTIELTNLIILENIK